MADIEPAQKALERLQSFDTTSLPRTADLGAQLSFADAVVPANRLVEFFKRIPVGQLSSLPQAQINKVQAVAERTLKTPDEILGFSATQENASQTRQGLLDQLEVHYERAFNELSGLVSFFSSQRGDLGELEANARHMIEDIRRATAEMVTDVEGKKAESERALDEIRRVAAEQGVSQQAVYFKEESKGHQEKANRWRTATIWAAAALVVYAILAAYAHKLDWLGLEAADTYQTVQISLSKILIFGVLIYVLLLCARNFSANEHNAIVNKHRQNALLTFDSLVEAAGGTEAKDIVLAHAASAIFSPQETGYTRGSSEQGTGTLNAVSSVARLMRQSPQ